MSSATEIIDTYLDPHELIHDQECLYELHHISGVADTYRLLRTLVDEALSAVSVLLYQARPVTVEGIIEGVGLNNAWVEEQDLGFLAMAEVAFDLDLTDKHVSGELYEALTTAIRDELQKVLSRIAEDVVNRLGAVR